MEIAGEALFFCAICQTPASQQDAAVECPECKARYHADCWQENGGCGVYGCSRVPSTENREGVEIPAAYWGQDKKACSVCGNEMLAAAVRCLQCGTVFSSARPENQAEFKRRMSFQNALPGLRRRILFLFALCLIPFTAPFGAAIAFAWYRSKRTAIAKMPPLFPALCKIGIGLGAAQSLFLVVTFCVYWIRGQ